MHLYRNKMCSSSCNLLLVVDGHRCTYYSFGNLKLSLEKLSEIGDGLLKFSDGFGHLLPATVSSGSN